MGNNDDAMKWLQSESFEIISAIVGASSNWGLHSGCRSRGLLGYSEVENIYSYFDGC